MRGILMVVGVAAIGLGAPATAAAPDRLVVFGDSLVDPGNAYLGTHGQTAQPGYGYFDGRFTNGADYTDLVNARLTEHATGTTTNYTVPFLSGGDNFAVGGAQAAMDRMIGTFTVPGLASQLTYFAGSGQAVDPKALYVLNFGNNDVSALLAGEAAAGSPAAAATFAQQYTQAFVTTYLGAVQYLEGRGAKQFLIGGVPNPDIAAGVGLENALKGGLAALPLAPGVSLKQIDYFTFFNNLRADPTTYGLPANLDTNLADECVVTGSTPGVAVPPPPSPTPVHPDCTRFLSFDGVHPTAPVDVALARYVDGLIGVPLAAGAVPEPASWTLMIAGFGLTAAAVRRRRALQA